MIRNYLKYLLQKYIPNSIEYVVVLKSFYVGLIQNWKKFIAELKTIKVFKNSIKFYSNDLNYQEVVQLTFNSCFNVLKKLDMLYLGEINSGCHRFLFKELDTKELEQLLIELLNLGFIVEIKNKNNNFILDKKTSSNYLKKSIKSFTLIRIYKIYINSSNIEEFGSDIAFEIENWFSLNDFLITKSQNYIQNKMNYEDLKSTVDINIYNHKVEQIEEFYDYYKYINKTRVKEIDIVYTWVNDKDENWLQKKDKYLKHSKNSHESALSINRFNNRDELKYSLRSLEKYFSGYRKIFIVVDGQKPTWLKESDRLIIIDHKDIFPDTNVLPVFNSHAIETVLHRIKGLSEYYLYLNDDVMFSRVTDVSLFFPKKGFISIFPSTTTYIPFGNVDDKLLPVDTAAINTRKLLKREDIGFAINKFKHTPLPQIKSLLFELEDIFYKEIHSTREKRFRHRNDISLTSSLLFNFAYFKNIAIERSINYLYVDVGLKEDIFRLKKKLHTTVKNRPDVFCVNDVNQVDNGKDFFQIIDNFLPNKSSYEKG